MSSLRNYRSKRHFYLSPEPMGNGLHSSSDRRFVIQKHAASHLHYDFRLELDGALKSWAIPKGPSLNPHKKHLAIMVEDHPLEYRTFEGTIPKGEYGAGTVMVWDEGTYHAIPDDTPRAVAAAIASGRLEITLKGRKLNGTFSLIRLKNDGKSWLLIKKQDAFAHADHTILSDRSVLTNRTMEEIASGAKPTLEGSTKATMPHHVKPMLCALAPNAFNDAEWLFEIKWDGYRGIAEVKEGKVDLYSRNNHSLKDRFPTIVQALQKVEATAIFDGEIVVLDTAGKSRFQLLQNYQKNQDGVPVYYIFDLLYLDGHDLRGLPLVTRKNLLRELLQKNPQEILRLSDHIVQEGKSFFKATAKNGLEGIIAKHSQSHYEHRRSREWLKIKATQVQEAIICGFTAPQKSRKYFGSLLLGVHEDKKVVFIGRIGTGFSERTLKDVHALLVPLITQKCPFTTPPQEKLNHPTWVKPKILCEVTFTEWTSDGRLRHPSFKGLRSDKDPKEIIRKALE